MSGTKTLQKGIKIRHNFLNFISLKFIVMKKVLIAVLPLVAVAMLALRTIGPLPIGATIPSADLKMKDIHGKEVSFKDAMSKNGLLVMFSCNTCPVVKGYQPRTNEICKYAMDKQIGVILLNSNEAYRDNGDSYNDMQAYGKKNNYSWYYVVDNNSTMADALGANPTQKFH